MSGARGASGRVEELEGERDVLLSSIEDLDREHAAGDVADEDYDAIRASYVERAATTLRALESARASRADPPAAGARRATAAGIRSYLGRRRVRAVLVAVGVVCAAGLVAIAAARAAGVRLPGASATGSVSLPTAARVSQELDQAAILASSGQLTKAVGVYDTILSSAPRQPEALAYKGWLVRLAGIARHAPAAVESGDALVAEAVSVAPGYAEARAFDAVALLEDRGDAEGAVAELAAMLSDRPGATLVASVAPYARRAYEAVHEQVPAAFHAAQARERAGSRSGRSSGAPAGATAR